MSSSGEGHSLSSGPSRLKKDVVYLYDPNIGNFSYGKRHPMQPRRIATTHEIVRLYGLLDKMQVIQPLLSKRKDFHSYHSEEYISFLSQIKPGNEWRQNSQCEKFKIDSDCPIYTDMYEFCRSCTGGSVGGAVMLNNQLCDIAINWSGGLHHAQKDQASGFCYVNDAVLAIKELLNKHQRVLYIDIDVHHGDGVEQAFVDKDEVMTVSFHKYGIDNKCETEKMFFPGTGKVDEIGYGKGKYYAVNVPLDDGIDDESYQNLFRPIIDKVMEVYRPTAVVLQCGADSLSGDPLGSFNLSTRGHGDCVRYVRSLNLPLLLLGGGGYEVNNVVRCWSYETAIALGVEIDDKLPPNPYFGVESSLHVVASKQKNKNSKKALERIKNQVMKNLSELHRP